MNLGLPASTDATEITIIDSPQSAEETDGTIEVGTTVHYGAAQSLGPGRSMVIRLLTLCVSRRSD